jgi:formate dehydrogenase major subunit
VSKQEPFSRQTTTTQSRLRAADVTQSVCPYSAIGCGLLVFTKAVKVIDIDGNPPSTRRWTLNRRRRCFSQPGRL